MPLVVDINDWLDAHGELPMEDPRLYRKALRLVVSSSAPGRWPASRTADRRRVQKETGGSCLGLRWVTEEGDDRIHVHCFMCKDVEAIVSGWQDILWADGVMAPLPMTECALEHGSVGAHHLWSAA